MAATGKMLTISSMHHNSLNTSEMDISMMGPGLREPHHQVHPTFVHFQLEILVAEAF